MAAEGPIARVGPARTPAPGRGRKIRLMSLFPTVAPVLAVLLVVGATVSAADEPSLDQLAALGAAAARANPLVAAARDAEREVSYRFGFDVATGLYGDPADGALGSADDRQARGVRRSLDAAARRGFDASRTLHLRDYPLRSEQVPVVSEEVAEQVSRYRATRGLQAVSVDERLMAIAALHARRMASADHLSHVLPSEISFEQRLEDGDVRAAVAVENVAAGQPTLESVLESWRDSPRHNANLLRAEVTHFGFGVARAPGSRYLLYWCLVMAKQLDDPSQGTRAATTGTNQTP